MTLSLITPRALQPLTLAEAKLHLRVETDVTEDDTIISALIVSATNAAEHLMQRAVLPQTWQLTLDSFCTDDGALWLERPPVTSITSVQYLQASDGVLTTLSSGAYVLAAAGQYAARIVPAYGSSWPDTRAMPEAVRVQFVTGYAAAADVPQEIKDWIKLRIGALYENRAGWTLGKAIEHNPFIDRLLDRYVLLTC